MRQFRASAADIGVMRRAFYLALLLAGDFQIAEQATTEALFLSAHNEDLLLLVARETCRLASHHLSSVQCGDARAVRDLLPPELTPLFTLPLRIRQAFILRNLARMTEDECGFVLSLSKAEVREDLLAASVQLASLNPLAGLLQGAETFRTQLSA